MVVLVFWEFCMVFSMVLNMGCCRKSGAAFK